MEIGNHGALAISLAAVGSGQDSVLSITPAKESDVTRPAITVGFSLRGTATVCQELPDLVVRVGYLALRFGIVANSDYPDEIPQNTAFIRACTDC